MSRSTSAPFSLDSRWKRLFQAVVIVGAGWFAFWPSIHGEWLWDDGLEITENPVLHDAAGLARIWSGSANTDYFPLKTTLQWLLWQGWGDRPTVYHVTNVALHLLSALLVWRLLGKLGIRWAWLGGLLFAIHPLTVESVAWISELKNTLSLPLLLLAMIAYVDYDERGRWPDGALSVFLFVAAMLGKSSVVMFPVVILLHAWWKRGRLGFRDVRNSAPFFATSLFLGLATIWFQHHRAIGAADIHVGGLIDRVIVAGLAATFYFAKCIFPVGLLPIYPRWNVESWSLGQLLPWPLILVAFGWAWTLRKTWGRHVILGAGFFLLNLVPVLGFIPMSYMGITWVADHFAYLSLIGVIGLLVAGAGVVYDHLSAAARPYIGALLAVLLGALALESHRYAAIFHDQMALWTYTVERNPAAWPAQHNLGSQLFFSGHYAEALPHFVAAVQLKPDYPEAQAELADTLFHVGRENEALAHFEEVIRQWPGFAKARFDYGSALLKLGQNAAAISQLKEALRLKPAYPQAAYNLGDAFLQVGKIPDAIAQLQQAVKLDPDFADAHTNLGGVLFQLGRVDEAAEHFAAVVRLRPNDASALENLTQAQALQRQQRAAR